MECQTCHGTRFVPVQKRQTVTKTIYMKDGYACWPCDGGTPVREKFPTGKIVTINQLCTSCHGSGLAVDPAHNPDCTQCQGTGERNGWDMDEWTPEHCPCTNPIGAA